MPIPAAPVLDPARDIHPTAVVERGAELGVGVRLGPHAYVESGARVGDGCTLGPGVHVHGCVAIGARTVVGSHSVLGGEPQDVKYGGEPSAVEIGEGCRFHEHVTVHRATGEGQRTVVGAGVLLMTCSHVGHNCAVGDGATLVSGAVVGGHAQIGERAILSGNSAVHQFCRIGRLSLLGGGAMATRDVPPFSIASDAYPLVWRAPNAVGLRRAGFDSARRAALRAALLRLFRSGGSLRDEARALSRDPDPAVVELAEFVLASKRGVCTARVAADSLEAESF
jgi:UDP-N-acetylglucosamine acyltransferase